MALAQTLIDRFKLDAGQTSGLADSFYAAKSAAYRAELVRLANLHGLDRQRAVLSPEIRAELRREAERHAQMVVQTYNRFLVNEVHRLSHLPDEELMPRLVDYMKARGENRAALIARAEMATARLDAQLSFYRENGVEPQMLFEGGAPECAVCDELMSSGPFGVDEALSIGYPHINCQHDWVAAPVTAAQLREGGVRPGKISVGRGQTAGVVGGQPLLKRTGGQAGAVAFVKALA